MPARGSFQKHQKELARKEKRQQKLDRRQGRTSAEPQASISPAKSEEGLADDSEANGLATGNSPESLPESR